MVEDLDDEEEGGGEFEPANGDRLFVTTLQSQSEEVRASSTISQRLEEAFRKNNKLALVFGPAPYTGSALTTSQTSLKYSPRSCLTSYLSLDRGITLLSSCWERSPRAARCICSHPQSRSSWTPSLRRTWKQDISGLPNPRWRLWSSSSKRKTEAFNWSKTTGFSIPSPPRTSTRSPSSQNSLPSFEEPDTSPSWTSGGVLIMSG
jgi:hypothetical protein